MCRDNKVSRGTPGPAPSTTSFGGRSRLSSDGSDGQAPRPNAWEWHCGMCTLINRPSNDACEICGFPRPTRGEAAEQTSPSPKGRSADASSSRDASLQSPGQQILASLRQKADSPPRPHGRQGAVDSPISSAGVTAGCEILAALRGGSAQSPSSQCPILDPSRELLATLKSGPPQKAAPDFARPSKDCSEALYAGGRNDSGWFKSTRKAARKGRRGGYGEGHTPMYSQAASGA